eukprot:jgi/Ulvmu1/4881/UM020_0167.1
MVKRVQSETADTVSVCHTTSGGSKGLNEQMADCKYQRIKWTRDEMLAIAPDCKSLPDGLGVIPEHLSSLFDIGQSSSLRGRGKGRVALSAESETSGRLGRKRVEDSCRTAEQTSAWRKKDRAVSDVQNRTESHGAKGRTAAEAAWRPRRTAQDDGVRNATPPSAADGWLMPDASEEYELGGHDNNVEAFEVMRQQARAEWAQAQGIKPVQDSATEDLMNDLIAEAETVAVRDLGAPPGFEGMHASREQSSTLAHQKIDIQTLFDGIGSAAPGLNMLSCSASVGPDSAKEGTVVSAPPEEEMRTMLQAAPGLALAGTPEVPETRARGEGPRQVVQASVQGAVKVAAHSVSVSSNNARRGVDVGSKFNDGGADDAAPGLSLEDMPMSQVMPGASSPPSSSPKGSIWGPGLDAGAAGSIITSTDWSQMQEIWNREPASKSLEAAGMQRLNDEFNNDHLGCPTSTSMAGINQAHSLLGDSLAYGRHPESVGASGFAATQGPHARIPVSESMMALASMSLRPGQSTGGENSVHHEQSRTTVAGHGSHVQHDYGAASMVRGQQHTVQQRQPAHTLAQRRGAAEDPRLFEMYLKQLVANAQQQQQVGEQRVQATASSHTAHGSVVQSRPHQFSHAASATQQASLEQIRNLAPALHLAGTPVSQQRQLSHMSTARQLLPQASNAYTSLQDGHRMQDPTWMLRQLKESGHPQAHVAASVGNLAVQQSWATPTRVQVQYPSSTYDRRGHQATMQQYGAAPHAARVGPPQNNVPLQGMYVDQLTQAALQSAARQPQQQQSTHWLPQTAQHHQHNLYAAQVRSAPVQGLQQAMSRGGHYAVQSSLPRYYPDNTQPGYTTLYRR